MNELTKFLIKELLDEQKTVAIYGGGFKPPTKGHFNVAKQILNDFPEIDELKIFVGGGVRDGITQDESIQVWNIYKNYLSDKVSIEPSVAPVKSVLNYAKENPDIKVYWVLGAREGEESDLEDIAYRTRTISKYPNLEVKVITSTGGVSGTKTRAAIKAGNKEQFFQLIPDIKEKEQIWNIVSPVIKEVGEANLKPYKWEEVDAEGYYVYTRFVTDSETQYDVDIKSTVYFPPGQMESRPALEIEFTAKPKGAEGSSAKIVVNKGELYRVMATLADIIKKYIKKSKAQAIIYSPSKKSSEENFGTQRDNLYRAFISKAFPGTTFKRSGDDVTAILPNTIKEATKRVPQTTKSGKKLPASKHSDLYTDEDPKGTITGLGFKDASTAREGVSKINKANTTHAHKVQATLVMKQRAKVAIERTKDPEKKKNLQAAYRIWSDKLEQLKRKTKSMKKEATDPQAGTALPYGSGFGPVKELVTATQVICDNCGWEWDKADGGKDLYICHKCGHDNTPKKGDPFGLNELAKTFVKEVFEKDWNLQDGMLSLTKYMMDNGMNIKPLPKIKVISDDAKNASNLLGKTAYYNPADKSITLFTYDRHPKDVLRSFSHEMVHHMQNLEGRLGNINTTNTNEDGDLPEIEREAYEKGNMMLRNWEDNIKNV